MTLKVKQVRKAMADAKEKTLSDNVSKAIENFLNSISDFVDEDDMDLAELLEVFADDVQAQVFERFKV